MRFTKAIIEPGKQFTKKMPVAGREQWACCDCGLVHEYRFYSDKPVRLWFRVARRDKLTAELRKKRKHRMVPRG